MAYVAPGDAEPGTIVDVEIRDQRGSPPRSSRCRSTAGPADPPSQADRGLRRSTEEDRSRWSPRTCATRRITSGSASTATTATVGITAVRGRAARRHRLRRAARRRPDPRRSSATFGVVESVKAVSDLFAPAQRRGHRGERRPWPASPSWSTATRSGRAGCSGSSVADPAEVDDLLDADRLRRADRRRPDRPMPYGPHTPADRARMLEAIGIASVDELFADIPATLRASRPRPAGRPSPSSSWRPTCQALAGRNRTDLASLPGAGVYRHSTPPAVDQLLLRGEWYTAYTPYQPEISQGTLQSIYEYQSLLAELIGLDVVSASHYDGAAATAEAALMTCRATRRERVLVSRAVHPPLPRDARDVLRRAATCELDEIPLVADGPAAGTTDLAALERLLADAGPAGRRRRSPASRTSSACSSRWPRSAGWPTPPAPCSSPSSSRSRWPSSRRPATYGADIAAGRGPAARHPAPVRRPVPRHPGLRPTRSSARSRAGSSG